MVNFTPETLRQEPFQLPRALSITPSVALHGPSRKSDIQLVLSEFIDLTRINFYTPQLNQKRHFSKRNFDPIQPFYFRERIPEFRRRYNGISREKQPKLSISEPDLRSSTWIHHSTVEVTLLHRFLRVELISINSTKFYKRHGRRRRKHVFCGTHDRRS